MTATIPTQMIRVLAVECPAGDYWVGDPCYASNDYDRWRQMCDSSGCFQNTPVGVADDGAWCVGLGTRWGDGTYRDVTGELEFPVDAGMIGVVPVAYVDDPQPFGMHRVTFDRPFVCMENGGIISLGHIVIDTDITVDDEDEEA